MGYQARKNRQAARQNLNKDRPDSKPKVPARTQADPNFDSPVASSDDAATSLPPMRKGEEGTTAPPPNPSREAIRGSGWPDTAERFASGRIKLVPSAIFYLGIGAWIAISVLILRDDNQAKVLVDFHGFLLLLAKFGVATVILIIGLGALLTVNLISILIELIRRRFDL